jgi:predicted ATPase
MIESISATRFKSFREATLELAPLTLLIGANASGKSNFLEAVRLLTWLARGRRLDEILSAVQEEDQQVRGTVEKLPHPGGDTFQLGCRVDHGDSWNELKVTLRVTDEGLRIIGEEVTSPRQKVPLYQVTAPADPFTHEIQVQYNNFARGGTKPRVACSDQQAVFTQLDTPARFSTPKAQRTIPTVVGRYRELLTNVLFLDPSPRRMRQYSFISDRRLRADGSNLSSVLYALDRAGQRDAILAFIRALPEQDIRGLSFLNTPRNEVMLQLEESFGGGHRSWEAPLLSDGTLRVLAVAAAMLSAPVGSLVVVEEVDNGVHPSRAGLLLENILSWARRRELHVLLTAHNPALLDSLPEESVPNVVFCYREPATGDSALVRLQDLEAYPQLVAQGGIGQLMTRGILERVVKDPRTREQKQEQARQWIERLEKQVSAG